MRKNIALQTLQQHFSSIALLSLWGAVYAYGKVGKK